MNRSSREDSLWHMDGRTFAERVRLAAQGRARPASQPPSRRVDLARSWNGSGEDDNPLDDHPGLTLFSGPRQRLIAQWLLQHSEKGIFGRPSLAARLMIVRKALSDHRAAVPEGIGPELDDKGTAKDAHRLRWCSDLLSWLFRGTKRDADPPPPDDAVVSLVERHLTEAEWGVSRLLDRLVSQLARYWTELDRPIEATPLFRRVCLAAMGEVPDTIKEAAFALMELTETLIEVENRREYSDRTAAILDVLCECGADSRVDLIGPGVDDWVIPSLRQNYEPVTPSTWADVRRCLTFVRSYSNAEQYESVISVGILSDCTRSLVRSGLTRCSREDVLGVFSRLHTEGHLRSGVREDVLLAVCQDTELEDVSRALCKDPTGYGLIWARNKRGRYCELSHPTREALAAAFGQSCPKRHEPMRSAVCREVARLGAVVRWRSSRQSLTGHPEVRVRLTEDDGLATDNEGAEQLRDLEAEGDGRLLKHLTPRIDFVRCLGQALLVEQHSVFEAVYQAVPEHMLCMLGKDRPEQLRRYGLLHGRPLTQTELAERMHLMHNRDPQWLGLYWETRSERTGTITQSLLLKPISGLAQHLSVQVGCDPPVVFCLTELCTVTRSGGQENPCTDEERHSAMLSDLGRDEENGWVWPTDAVAPPASRIAYLALLSVLLHHEPPQAPFLTKELWGLMRYAPAPLSDRPRALVNELLKLRRRLNVPPPNVSRKTVSDWLRKGLDVPGRAGERKLLRDALDPVWF